MESPTSGFLSAKAYLHACGHLVESSKSLENTRMRIELHDEQEAHFLVISRRFSLQTLPLAADVALSEQTSNVDEENDEDIDDQAVVSVSAHDSPACSVIYSIVYSPTYQVPVLYFCFRDLPCPYNPNSVDTVYQLLVPQESRTDIESFSIIGGISMAVSIARTTSLPTPADEEEQNHPITDFPSFFIHPCNTAEAMRELLGGRDVKALEYLLIWLGLVGSCVGLFVPKELAVNFK
ncbi:MAG: hypothetical protein Q9195_005980 [Heterodermia aff. obscurata]